MIDIIFASYANVDITSIVQARVNAGQQIFKADTNLVGDPLVNVVKYLTITYRTENFEETVSIPDGELVTIPRSDRIVHLDYDSHWKQKGYPEPWKFETYQKWVEPKTIEDYYQLACTRPSEIHEHLPTIRRYAEQCEHVTEMGVSAGKSSWAIVAARPKRHRLYDINAACENPVRKQLALEAGIDYLFHAADTGNPATVIEPTDLLFIDTWHTYDQLKREFELHASKVRKFIILHDTTIFGDTPEPGYYNGVMVPLANPDKGLWPAVLEFLAANKEWQVLERFHNNSGLTVLGKFNDSL